MDLYVNISDKSEIAASLESRNTTARTVKSSYNFSAGMGTLLEWSAASQPAGEGSGGEVIGRYAATLFGSLILRKPGNIGGI
jgi:hypothetical protein